MSAQLSRDDWRGRIGGLSYRNQAFIAGKFTPLQQDFFSVLFMLLKASRPRSRAGAAISITLFFMSVIVLIVLKGKEKGKSDFGLIFAAYGKRNKQVPGDYLAL